VIAIETIKTVIVIGEINFNKITEKLTTIKEIKFT